MAAAGLLLGSLLARLGIYWAHADFFVGIDGWSFWQAAWRGLRYDIATYNLMVLPPLLLILLPGGAAWWRCLRALGYALLALFMAATVLFGVASTQFFAYFYRHLGVEVKTVFSDFDFILQMAVEQNLLALITVSAGLAVAVWFGVSQLSKLPVPQYGWKRYGVAVGCLALLGHFTVWGAPGRSWVDEQHAFKADDLRLGQLVLNPAFAAFNNLFFPQSVEAALADVRVSPAAEQQLGANNAVSLVLGQPLLNTVAPATKPNIVLVVLESWTPDFMAAFGASDSITPNFDRIAAKGRRYQQAYANGPISIYGLQALLTGMPHLPGMPLMGFGGVETLKLRGVASYAAEAGYDTLWAQAPRRASFNMDVLAKRWGFAQVAGSEDYHTPADWNKTPFGWDWPMYEYALAKFSELEAPFFATLYTAVTHVPYVRVPTQHELRPHNPDGLDGFINTLSRADWALGKFWQQAEQAGWHENTIYIFVADHVVPKDMPDKSVAGRYRIPLAIVGPGIAPGDDQQLVSHIDVLPTVRSLMGRQVVKLSPRSGVLTSDGALSYWLEPGQALGHYRKKPIFAVADAELTTVSEAAYVQQLRSSYQYYLNLK